MNINRKEVITHKTALIICLIVSAVVLFYAGIADHPRKKDADAAEIRETLREAERYATEGKIPEMEVFLSSVEKSAKEKRIDISHEMGIIKEVGYGTAADKTISGAFRFVSEGKSMSEIKALLKKYIEYCQKAGVPPDETAISKIRKETGIKPKDPNSLGNL